ncbi:hypothetical protein A6A07_37090 [Streptomyces sp. CB03911]|nr:hypothetical protein A6A07_37090 [Streptomyces sp. CB03911]
MLDTRTGLGAGTGRVGSDGVVTLRLAGLLVPAGTTAVVLNLTATAGSQDSFLTAFPSGQPRPGTSNVNFSAGQDSSDLVTVPVGADGSVSVYNHVGGVDIVADLFGYYRAESGHLFTPVDPVRLSDTRTPAAPWPAAYLCDHQATPIAARGSQPVPAGTTAVVLNVTAVDPRGAGFLRVDDYLHPTNTSNVNYRPGRTVANQVVVPYYGENTTVSVTGGCTDIVVDLAGYYGPDGRDTFTPVAPNRLFDSREPGGTRLGPDSTLPVKAAGSDSVPATATAVVLNLTETGADSESFFAVHPTGSPRPTASVLNFGAGQTVSNHVTARLGSGGQASVYNHVGRADAVVDVFGYFSTP